MKQILRNPFAYLSILLFSLLVFQVAQIVQGQTDTRWQPPTAPPPGGQPAPPLDIGGEPQTKQGNLNVSGDFTVSGDRGLIVRPSNATINNRFIQILTTTTQINFQDGVKNAAIRFFNGQLQARHDRSVDGNWFTLGAGTGGAGGGNNG